MKKYRDLTGQNVSLATVCEQYGINVDTVRDKLKNGRSLENAINTSAQAVTWDEHLLRLKEKRKGELDELLQYFLENPESSNRKTARAMGWSVRKVQRMKADLRADGKHLPE